MLPAKDNFYTYEEIRDFTNNFTVLTIINITKFIEDKTSNEYTVTKRKLIIDFKEQFFQNNIAIFEIQKFLNDMWAKTKDDEATKQLGKDINKFLIETWSKVNEKNWFTVGKWADELKDFEFPVSPKDGESK